MATLSTLGDIRAHLGGYKTPGTQTVSLKDIYNTSPPKLPGPSAAPVADKEKLTWAGISTGEQQLPGVLQDVMEVGQLMSSTFFQGINTTWQGLINLPDNAVKVATTAYSTVHNTIVDKLNAPNLRVEPTTLSKLFFSTIGQMGVQPIDTSKIDNPILKNIATNMNEGNNIFSGLVELNNQYFINQEKSVQDRVGFAGKLMGDVVRSWPQMALMALPFGQAVYSAVTFSNNISDALAKDDSNPEWRKISYGLYQANVEIASEMIFALFGGSGALLPSAATKTVGKTVAPTVWKLIGTAAKSGIEEGAEEMIAFPFQIALDWRYNNPDRPIREMWREVAIMQNAKDWGYAGLVGFVSGGLMSAASIVRTPSFSRIMDTGTPASGETLQNVTYTKEQRARLSELSQKIMGKPINALTENDVTQFFDTFSQIVIKQHPDGFDVLGSAAEAMGKTPPIAPTQADPANPQTAAQIPVSTQTRGRYVDPFAGMTFQVEGDSIQAKTISIADQQISAVNVAIDKAKADNNTMMVKLYEDLREAVTTTKDEASKNPAFNPYNITETTVEFSPGGISEQAPAAHASPVAPPVGMGVPPVAQTPPATAQTAQQAPAGTSQTQRYKSRAEAPSYLAWLEHQKRALEYKAASKNTPADQANSIRSKRIPQMDARIEAEKEAIRQGTTTEKGQQTAAPKTAAPPAPATKTAAPPAPAPVQAPAKPAEAKPVAPVKKAPVKKSAEPKPVAPAAPVALPKPVETKKPVAPKKAETKPAAPAAPVVAASVWRQESTPDIVARIDAKSKEYGSVFSDVSHDQLSQDQIDMAQIYYDFFGVNTHYYKGNDFNHGFYNPQLNIQFVNIASDKITVASTVSHELYHGMSRMGHGTELTAVVAEMIGIKNVNDYAEWVSALERGSGKATADSYRNKGWMNASDMAEEVVARVVEDAMTTQAFWDRFHERLGRDSAGVFSKVYKWFQAISSIWNQKPDSKVIDAIIDALEKTIKVKNPALHKQLHIEVNQKAKSPPLKVTVAEIAAFIKKDRVIDPANTSGRDTVVLRKIVRDNYNRIASDLISNAKKGKAANRIIFEVADGTFKISETSFISTEVFTEPDVIASTNSMSLARAYESLGMTATANGVRFATDMVGLLNSFSLEAGLKLVEGAGGWTDAKIEAYQNIKKALGKEGIITGAYLEDSLAGSTPIPAMPLFYEVADVKAGMVSRIYFSKKALAESYMSKHNLVPYYHEVKIEETAEIKAVSDTVKQIRVAEAAPVVAAPETTATGAYRTVSYPDANINIVYNTDTNKAQVFIVGKMIDGMEVVLSANRFTLNKETGAYERSLTAKTTPDALRRLPEEMRSLVGMVVTQPQTDTEPKTMDKVTVLDSSDLETRIMDKIEIQEDPVNVMGGNTEAMTKMNKHHQFFDPKDSWSVRFQKMAESFKQTFLRGAVPFLSRTDKRYGELIFKFINIKNVDQSAGSEAIAKMTTLYSTLDRAQYNLFTNFIVLKSLADDIQHKRVDTTRKNWNPWGFTDASEVYAELAARENVINMPRNSNLREIYNFRKAAFQSLRANYTAIAKQLGYDPSLIWTHEEYFHHVISENIEAFRKQVARGSGFGRTFLFDQRNQNGMAYLTDVVLADFLVSKQLFKDIQILRLIAEVQKFDQASLYGENVAIPDGMSEVRLGIFGQTLFPTEQIRDILVDIAEMSIKATGIDPNSRAAIKMIENAKEQAKMNTRMVLPTEIALQIKDAMKIKEHSIPDKVLRTLNNTWRASVLRGPESFFRYFRNNLTGDLQAVVMGQPKVLLKVPQALKELYNWFKSEISTIPLQHWIMYDGLSSGMTEVELPDFQKLPGLKFYDPSWSKGKTIRVFTQMFRRGGAIDVGNQFREQILRYAAFLHFMDNGLNKQTDLPNNFVASRPAIIQGIQTREGRAAKMANDLLGAYNDTSVATTWISTHMIPFFRFRMINLSRTAKIITNLFRANPNMVIAEGKAYAKKLGIAGRIGTMGLWKLGWFVVRAMSYSIAALALNDKDEEELLPDYVRNKVHFNLGKWNGRLHYLGSFDLIEDMLDIVGLGNYHGMIGEVINGRRDIKNIIAEMWEDPSKDWVTRMLPLYSMTRSLVTGYKDFPDTRKSRDPWGDFFGLFALRSTYKLITNKPIPDGKAWDALDKIFSANVELEYSKYWAAKEDADIWLQSLGRELYIPNANTSEKGNAIYYFKEAVRIGDDEAAIRYLSKYIIEGGTAKSFKQSMQVMHPLNSVPKTLRGAYVAQLSTKDRAMLDDAMAYYQRMQEEGYSYWVNHFNETYAE